MRIVKAGPEHLPAIMEIERESFSRPWSETSVLSELTDLESICLAAAEGGRLMGFAILHTVGEEGELYNIAVAEGDRGRGAGGALLDAALREACRRGVLKVYLEVRRSNSPARALYKSRGFQVSGMRRDYYDDPKEDAMLMDVDLPGELEMI